MENLIKGLEQESLLHCRFCNPPERDRILFEGDYFYIMLSLGPIVEGYLLLISKDHINSCAEIPENQCAEFDLLYSKIKDILIEQYGAVICYEHGRAGSCLIPMENSKHCFHAHMHFVPVSVKLNTIVEKDYDGSNIYELKDLRDMIKDNRAAYLYVEDSEKKSVYEIEGPVRRQYLRFKVAQAIGDEKLWNWIDYQNWETVIAGKTKLLSYFKSIV